MVRTREARRGEAPSTQGETKNKGKERKRSTCKKKGDGATPVAPGAAAPSKKKRKKKAKKQKKRAKAREAREASEQKATVGGVARLERQEGAAKAVEANTAGKRERNKDKDKVVVC